MWAIMVYEIYEDNQQYVSAEEFKTAIPTIWNNINSETWMNFLKRVEI